MSPSWETVRALAGELPGAEEGTSDGTPAFEVRGRLFARLREDGETLVVYTDYDEREALTQSEPETFLVSLPRVDPTELAELLTESWRQRVRP